MAKPDYSHAANFLRQDLDTVKTNEPIARQEGRTGQANLQRDEAKSINAALKVLMPKKMRDKTNG